jgi:hypothetical protein
MSLRATVEAPSFLEQRLLFFIGEERCSIVLSPWRLGFSATRPRGIHCIHIHCVIISSPTLSLALQGLFLSVLIVSEEWVGECGFVFRICGVMRPG